MVLIGIDPYPYVKYIPFIVDFPIQNGDFNHSYVNVYQAGYISKSKSDPTASAKVHGTSCGTGPISHNLKARARQPGAAPSLSLRSYRSLEARATLCIAQKVAHDHLKNT
jgi:hypothetical protein